MAVDSKNRSKNGTHAQVQDDGTIDSKLKDRILKARDRVDDREDYLYIEAAVENSKTVEDWEQSMRWGMVVKQYLRTIEPLLRNDYIDGNQEYYTEKPIGSVTLHPRSTDEYPFERLHHEGVSHERFKIRHNLPRDAELPTPVTHTYNGLKSIIEADTIVQETWFIEADRFTAPRTHGVIETSDSKPLPKELYIDAVREADAFLDQAGIGLEIGEEGLPSDKLAPDY